MKKPDISIHDYTYNLPDERIAKYPLARRDESKLLVYRQGNIEQSVFNRLGNFLPEESLLVFNNTKVIRARLHFQKPTGAMIEIFCLEPLSPVDISQTFKTCDPTTWKCIIGNARKWKGGTLQKQVTINSRLVTVMAEKGASLGNAYEVIFSWDDSSITFAEVIEHLGHTPIPPYLNRETESIDEERYQTVYSVHQGSVAAPTAGLHFTPEVLSNLKEQHHNLAEVTLHVGAGTFKPVKSEHIADHEMHTEHFFVEAAVVKQLLANAGHVISVGTTSVRTLESLYWLGVRILENISITDGVSQWDPYNLTDKYSTEEALTALLTFMQENQICTFASKTCIIIVPGYKFRIIEGLVTNFHQPQSTLLLLISALIGNNWNKVYNYALENDFRFLSYGDSSLLLK
ncbi:S-adenosylmethionine:tRNA ribosyltransferase-isomerase [Marinilabiliaceae bacterium JC017]|nr:S-adenosylmethionine:tRNA ribosyltransferase-isomerase [Marinilabiliaceae bacterium JC017]